MSYIKGPWHMEENKLTGAVDIISEGRYFILSTTIDTDIIGERIDKANAKLIAAAPELVETLRECLDVLVMLSLIDKSTTCDKMAAKVEATIKKACG